MNKELLQQLNKLKEIKPDSAWRESNREILFNQIKNSYVEPVPASFNLSAVWKKFYQFMSQPATVVITIIVMVAGFLSLSLRGTQPGDSLYIAKVISEKAMLAITFNQSEKTKLTIKYASDHAKEITKVLADPEFDHQNEQNKKDRLTEDFKNEISSVRETLSSMSVAEAPEQKIEEPVNAGDEASEEDTQVFSADFKKDKQGVEISEAQNVGNQTQVETQATSVNATSSSSDQKEENTSLKEANKVLEEAQVLFNESDYNGALGKIEEADVLIEGGLGEVKGVNETATSSGQ